MDDNAIIGPQCIIATSKHERDELGYVTHHSTHRTIRIGKGSWLSGNVVVTDGVSIGQGVIVGAGAVVTKDLPDFCLAGGVPCKIIRRINSCEG